MTKLILVRHGQSLANAKNLFAGHSDFDLTDFGHLQASLGAAWIEKNETVHRIYASDLLRAYHTATPIGEALQLPVIKDEGLREIFGGAWESMSFEDIATAYPNEFDVWRNDYAHARPVNGEATAEVYGRIVPHICELAKENDGHCILLATHATVVRAFDAYAHGFGAYDTGKVAFCYNAAINIYTYDNGKVAPLRTNLTEHLGSNTSCLPPIINA